MLSIQEEVVRLRSFPIFLNVTVKGKFLTDSQKGCGLGLAILKKIMELHNTYINVKSVLNQGTEFFFSLPVDNRYVS